MAEPANMDRDLEIIVEPEKIQHLLKNHLSKRTLLIQGSDPPGEAKIAGFDEGNILSVDLGALELQENDQIKLFRILGRYIELSCVVMRATESKGIYLLNVHHAGISRKERAFARIPLQPDEVHISNIRTSKQTIDATLFHIPASVRVNFGLYEQKLKNQADFVKIDVFGPRGTIWDEMRKSGKTLLITDTRVEAHFRSAGETLDYADFLEDKLRKRIEEYRKEKIISELAVPVIYVTHDQTRIPLGYIQLQSRTRLFTAADIAPLKTTAEELVNQIRDSNTVLLQDKEQVINISRGGLKAVIRNPQAIGYLTKQNGFTFDLFFRMQAPITLFAIIRSMRATQAGELYLSLQFRGSSSYRKDDLARFKQNMDQKEKQYEAILAKRKALSGQK